MEAQSYTANLGVVILAAGRSRRMGRPKLLLPWNGTSVLGHQIETWRALGAGQIAVVCAKDDDAMNIELNRLNCPATNRIQNPDPEQGMFSSIVCAVRWNGWHPELTRWVLTLGDQPHLKIETLQTLLKFSAANPERVCQPRGLEHLRHPVILPKQFFRALGQTTALTLKEFLKTIPEAVSACDVDDAGLDWDLDTPDDYDRVLEFFSGEIDASAH